MKKPAQNLVEFVIVFPLLLVILFGIIEFAIYYRTVSVVQDIATEAAVTASRRLVTDTMTAAVYPDANFNIAVNDALNIVINRKGNLSFTALDFTYIGAVSGVEPYAQYRFDSTQTKVINGVATPLVTFYADYRDPLQNGISVQVIYQYRTLFGGMQIPVPGVGPIVILPKYMTIRSTNVTQYLSY